MGYNLNLIEEEVREDVGKRNVIDNLPYYSHCNKADECTFSDANIENSADCSNAQIMENIRVMQLNADNRAYRKIYSCRKVIGGLIVFVKRVIRKLLKWYLEPVCDQQSDFNLATVSAVSGVKDMSTGLQMDISLLQKKVDILQSQQKEILAVLGPAEQGLNDVSNRLFSFECSLRLIEEVKKKAEDRIIAYEEEIERYKHQNDENSSRDKETIQLLKKAVESLETQLQGIGEDIKCCSHQDDEEGDNEAISLLKETIETLRNRYLETQQIIKTSEERLNGMERKLAEMGPKYEFGAILSSAQSGEDTIIAYVLDSLKIPFNECTYLDIGANHAKAMSNTYMFYRFGARGVLIEANPALIEELEQERKGDIILNYCVSEKSGEEVNFYVLNGDGLSSPSLDRALDCIKDNPKLKIDSVVPVKTIRISDVLKQYFRELPILVSLDIEGDELRIIEDMDLEHNRIKLVIIETIPYSPTLTGDSKNMRVIEYMRSIGYIEYAFTGINSIFVDANVFAENQLDS